MKKHLSLCVFVLAIFIFAAPTFAEITGSTLITVNKYIPGVTNTLIYRCDAVTPDYEYIYTVIINYATGMNVVTGYKATGDLYGGTFSYNGAAGDAAVARWDSDENLGPGYGSLADGESAYFTNDVDISSSITGDVVLTYYLFGDGYGDAPHALTNTLTITKQENDVNVSPMVQEEKTYRTFNVDYQLEIQNLFSSNETFNLSYISNNWPVTGPAATASLPVLGIEKITTTVSVPASATPGQIETSTVIAVSVSDPSISNAGILITECLSYFKGTNIYCNDFNSWPPAGWSLYELADPAGWGTTNPGADGTGACAFHNDDNVASGCDDWLVSPAIDLSLPGGYPGMRFVFDNKIGFSSFFDYSRVLISTENINPESNDYVETLDVGDTDTSWTERNIDLATYIGSNPVYIAFRYRGDYAHEWSVDNPCVISGGEFIPGIVTGLVADASSAAPINNAVIEFQSATAQEQTATGADGLYEKALSSNSYTAIASAAGYYPQTQNVIVAQSTYSALNFNLATKFVSNPPTAATEAAYPVTWDFAILKGIANPNGIQSYAYFEYGVDTNYGFRGPVYIIGSDTNDVNIVETSSQLTPNSTYHYRLVSYNSIGTNYGNDQAVTTIAAPVNMPAMWFQPLNMLGSSHASQSATNYPFDARLADDFMYSTSTTALSQVRWWVNEFNGTPPYVSPYAFNIYLYTNSPGGAGCYPTNIIQSWTIPTSECHEELFDTNTLVHSYWAELSPAIIPQPGVHYWLCIQPALNSLPQCGLVTAATSVNLCTSMQIFVAANIKDWTPTSADTAYILYPAGNAKISVDLMAVDFGQVEVDTTVITNIAVSNIGTDTLIVNTSDTNCTPQPGIISIDWNNANIITGDIDYLQVTANTTGFVEDVYTCDVIFVSNDSSNPRITVPVSLEVIPEPTIIFGLLLGLLLLFKKK